MDPTSPTAPRNISEERLIFSMAIGHSGHTLFALLVGAHPEVAHLGDTVRNRNRGIVNCACGVKTTECRFWQRVYAWDDYTYLRDGFPRSRLTSFVFSRPELFPVQRLLRRARFDRYGRTLARFAAFVRELTGRRQLIFGRKRMCDLLLTLADPAARVRVLHLTRHPLGHMLSCSKRPSPQGQTAERWAQDWVRYNSRVHACRSIAGEDDYLHVAYDDLCRAPDDSLERVCAWLGVPFDSAMLQVHKEASHLIGSKSVLGRPFDGLRPPDVNAGLRALSLADRKTTWRIAGPLAETLGYREQPG